MLPTMPLQAHLNASGLVPIGAVATHFGLRTSALRYYEERGLVTATTRRRGQRCYDRVQLRRLAFVQVGRQLGLTLDQLGEILDGPEHRWRALVDQQIAALDEQAERIRRARAVLAHALECRTANPVRHCPTFATEFDRLVDAGAEKISQVTNPGPTHCP